MGKENKIFTPNLIFKSAKENRKGVFVPHPIFKNGTYSFNTRMTIDPRYEQNG